MKLVDTAGEYTGGRLLRGRGAEGGVLPPVFHGFLDYYGPYHFFLLNHACYGVA